MFSLRMALLTLLFFLAIEVASQSNYRIKNVGDISYILPPTTNLKFHNGVPKNRFSFYNIQFDVASDYQTSVNNLDKALRWRSSKNYFSPQSDKLVSATADCPCPVVRTTFFNAGFFHRSGSIFFLQLAYGNLTAGNPVENFRTLAIDLIKTLATFETKTCCAGSLVWPQGLSQRIVERIFEMLPTPVEASLSKYCHKQTDPSHSTVLISSDFIIETDVVKKTTENNGNFAFEWIGTASYQIDRLDDGRIVQKRLFTGATGLPNNLINSGANTYKLSSFADIQQSSILGHKRYVVLYSPIIKRNNNIASSKGKYPAGADDELQTGNDLMVHLNNAELAVLDFTADLSKEDLTKSAFSERSAINVRIPVFINGILHQFVLGTRLANLSQLPGSFTIYRKWHGKYKRIKGDVLNLILLPNDHIEYQL